jgi:hypothetical protein
MIITKSYVKAVITAIVLIAAATTIAFPNATLHATLTTTPEQTGTDDATTNATTTPQTAEPQQQQTIHITKDSTNSYVISGGSSSVGSFDTTYRIAGERSAVRASEDLIITTITEDFRSSPTIGYVTAGTTGVAAQDTAALPNPFATPEQITERITSDLRRVITEAENNTSQGQFVEINCNFGMMLDEMHCHYIPLLGGVEGAGGESADTTTTDTTGTTDTTTSISP